MKTLFRIGIWGVLFGPLFSLSQSAGNESLRVVLFGDSMVKGVGVDSTDTFGYKLAQQLDESGATISFVNAGKVADRTDIGLARMQQDVVVKRPDVVLIMYGAFDAMVDSGQTKARVPLNVFEKQVTQIVSFLKGIDVTPILMTSPPVGMAPSMDREPYASAGPNFLLKIYMEKCRKLAQASRIPLVDHYQAWMDMEEKGVDLNTLRLDGFHPNPLGHKKMAELIQPVLKGELGPKFSEVFMATDSGYSSFEAPALHKTKNGFLLAMSIGNRSNAGIQSSDLVYKRSFDKGVTWTELDTLVSGGYGYISHPITVQDEASGKVFLHYQVRPGFSEGNQVPLATGHKGENIAKAFVITTSDEGKTWTEPVEVTKDIKRPKDVTLFGGGTSYGVQLTGEKVEGRMILPFSQEAGGKSQVYTIYTDNLGKSWKYTDLIGGAEDKQLVNPYLTIGPEEQLLMGAFSKGDNKRYVASSSDGGKSWSDFTEDSAAPQEGMSNPMVYRFNLYYTLYVGCEDGDGKGALKLSTDKGKTWPYSQTFYSKPIGKSAFIGTGATRAGILYESGDPSSIQFAQFPIKWLLVNKSLQ